MSATQIIGQVVPDDFAETLRQWRADQPAHRLDSLLLAANTNGWTLQALGDALGLTRERVRQRVATASPAAGLPAFPLPPRRRNPTPERRRRRLELSADLAEQLREMHAIAATVNGGTPRDHRSRRISEQYAAQLNAYVEQGITLAHLAEVVGVTPSALTMRLGRHGYRDLAPSQAHQRYRNKKTGKGPCGPEHLIGDNLYISPDGARRCRECARRKSRAHYARVRHINSPESVPPQVAPASPSPAERAAADGEVPGGSQVPEFPGTEQGGA